MEREDRPLAGKSAARLTHAAGFRYHWWKSGPSGAALRALKIAGFSPGASHRQIASSVKLLSPLRSEPRFFRFRHNAVPPIGITVEGTYAYVLFPPHAAPRDAVRRNRRCRHKPARVRAECPHP